MAHTDKALSIRYHGTVVCLGAGRGIHTIVPLARDPKTAGNRVVSILGANAEPDLVREEAIRQVSDEVIVSALGKGLGEYSTFCNHERPRQSLSYQTPAEVHFAGVSCPIAT